MTRITTATASQWAEIDRLRDEVIASVAHQPEDEAVRRVVRNMWSRMSVEPAAVLIAASGAQSAVRELRRRQSSFSI